LNLPVQPNYSCQQGQFIDSEIQNLLKKGVIVESTREPNEYISPIFLRPKKDGSHRLILNLKTQKIKEACQKLLQSPQPTIRGSG
jgi:hypothetical protein